MHSAHAKTGIRRVGLTGLPGFSWRRGRANRYLLLAAALGVLVAALEDDDLNDVLHAARTLELLGEDARPAADAIRAARDRARGTGNLRMYVRFSTEAFLAGLK